MGKPLVRDSADDKDSFVDELKPGTKLMHGQYTIESFLNAGGFGITYLARDSLDRKIVIKECFPGAFCRRSRFIVQARSRAHQNELQSIVRLFVQEARSLAKLDHPNIVGVHQVFEDNETAYMALDFVEGRDLLDTIEDPNHGLTPPQIKLILKEVLGAVGFIHDQGILHRDISPDNILIDQKLRPVLIDFGAAREEATKQSRVLSALRVVKDGYSPQEFYIAGSEQSPSSDLYALAASFHHLIAKEVPPNSQARLAAIASSEPDPYVPLSGRHPEYDAHFLAAIDKALEILPKDRLQSANDWLVMMEGGRGNVTPLNIAHPQKEALAKAAAATPAPVATKSKLPLLLGSAAVVAIVIGVGVLTMTGGEVAPSTPAAQTAAATPETPALEASAPVEEVATITPEVIVPEAAAPEAEVADVVAPEQEVAIAAEPAQEAIAELAPEVIAEPAPEPVETPRVAAADPSSNPDLPEQIVKRPATDGEVVAVDLPGTPEGVAEIGFVTQDSIAAVVPGNELIASPLSSEWTVQLPFTTASEGSNIIGEAATNSPAWVQSGLEITAVNGSPVTSIADIQGIMRDEHAGTDIDSVPVTFTTVDPATGAAVDHDWIMPVVHMIALDNGLVFDTAMISGEWRTTVSAVPDALARDIKVGDVMKSYIPTSEPISGRDALKNILDRELTAGTEQFMFAVQREGSMWVASLRYAAKQE